MTRKKDNVTALFWKTISGCIVIANNVYHVYSRWRRGVSLVSGVFSVLGKCSWEDHVMENGKIVSFDSSGVFQWIGMAKL